LKQQLASQGWKAPSGGATSGSSGGSSSKSDSKTNSDSKKGNKTDKTEATEGPITVNAAIDPSLFEEYESPGVYAFNQGRHKLADSTLFDNCGALNLVN
jgi:hypothetical protein